MVGMTLEGRVENALDLGLAFQPTGDIEGAALVFGHADGERTKAAGHEKSLVTGGEEAEQASRLLDRGPGRFHRRNRAGKGVGMADEHLGARVHDDVGAERQGTMEEGAGPTVVDDDPGAAGMGGLDDRGQILDLERPRAGAFDKDSSGFAAHEVGDTRPDARIIIARADAHALEKPVGETARRFVGTVGDENLVARIEAAHDCNRDCRQPRRSEEGAMRAFQLRDDRLDLDGGRIARPPIEETLLLAFEVVERFEEDGRSAIDWGVDEAELVIGHPPVMSEHGFHRQLRIAFRRPSTHPMSLHKINSLPYYA
jgi:hypothetical protein